MRAADATREPNTTLQAAYAAPVEKNALQGLRDGFEERRLSCVDRSAVCHVPASSSEAVVCVWCRAVRCAVFLGKKKSPPKWALECLAKEEGRSRAKQLSHAKTQ